jgi:hypothetical protein
LHVFTYGAERIVSEAQRQAVSKVVTKVCAWRAQQQRGSTVCKLAGLTRTGAYRVVAAPVLGVLAAGVDVVRSGGVECLSAVGLVLLSAPTRPNTPRHSQVRLFAGRQQGRSDGSAAPAVKWGVRGALLLGLADVGTNECRAYATPCPALRANLHQR